MCFHFEWKLQSELVQSGYSIVAQHSRSLCTLVAIFIIPRVFALIVKILYQLFTHILAVALCTNINFFNALFQLGEIAAALVPLNMLYHCTNKQYFIEIVHYWVMQISYIFIDLLISEWK